MTAEPHPPQSPRVPPSWIAPVVQLHRDVEAQMLAAVAKRLARDLASTDWARLRIGDLAGLQREIDALVARLGRQAAPLVAEAITRAYQLGNPGARRPDSLIERVLAALRQMWARIRSAVLELFNGGVAAGQYQDGLTERRAIVQQVLDRAADRGVTAYRDLQGRRWGLGSYAETVVGDAAHGAGTDAFTAALLAQGGDLVIVTESPHPCPICRPWEHRVLSVTGTDPARPSLATARSAGLFHPHCRHTVFAWQPGFRWPPHSIEHRPGTYEAEQRQRQIEAHIRRWKRREAVALDDLAGARARRRVRAWQVELRAHLAATGLQRSRMRERTDFARTSPHRHAFG
jgi:minor capsid protein 2